MTQIEVSTSIRRPSDDVFAFIADFENNPRWQSAVQTATFTSDGTLDVGSTYRQVSTFLGRRIESDFEVTEYDPGRKVRIESLAGTFPIQVTRSVEAVDGGTRVTATIEGEPDGVFRIAMPVLNRVTKRRIEGDYAALKELLESTGG